MKKIAVLLLLILEVLALSYKASAQGNNTGLGGNDNNILSIGERLFNLEKKSEAFQCFLNMKTGYRETVAGGDVKGQFGGYYFRPEVKGVLGKWGYRVRIDMTKSGTKGIDGMLSSVNFMSIYYKANDHWNFVFGKKALQYGTFENEWNSLKVIQFHEFFNNVPGMYGVAADANFTAHKQTFGIEVANASTNDFYTNYPNASQIIEKNNHPLQYTASWMGSLFDDFIMTKWSCTLFNQAKGCLTNQIALGTVLKFNKVALQLDYVGAYGKLDYLGIITKDAIAAGIISEDEMVLGADYSSVTLDLGYWPTPRWNLFLKCGNCNSSARNIESLRDYRTTYEYTLSAQYVLDPTQDLRVSLAYVGKHVRFSPLCNLEKIDDGFIELALIYRLKAF